MIRNYLALKPLFSQLKVWLIKMETMADVSISPHLKVWIYLSKAKKHQMLKQHKAWLIMDKPFDYVIASHIYCRTKFSISDVKKHDKCAWKVLYSFMLMRCVVEPHECLPAVLVYL